MKDIILSAMKFLNYVLLYLPKTHAFSIRNLRGPVVQESERRGHVMSSVVNSMYDVSYSISIRGCAIHDVFSVSIKTVLR